MIRELAMAGVEELKSVDHAEANRLIDRCMRAQEQLSMTEDFPLLIGSHARTRRTVIRREGRILAHVAARVVVCQTPAKRLCQIYNLGAVCTKEEARGEGLAAQLIEEQLRFAKEQGVELAMLWAEVEGFYERFGFHYAGLESRFLVGIDDLPSQPKFPSRSAVHGDILALQNLRQKDPCPIGRSFADAEVLFDLPLSQTRVAEVNGEILSYITVGKGLDFQDTVCEWAGPIDVVQSLIRNYCAQENREALLVIGPSWDNAFFSSFMSLGCPHEAGHLAMFKVLNTGSFRKLVDPHERTALPTEPGELLWTAFGSIERPASAPALPFYVWGLDSM